MRMACAAAQVDAAAKVIQELLTPKEDSENEWKRMQLRELAMITRAGHGIMHHILVMINGARAPAILSCIIYWS